MQLPFALVDRIVQFCVRTRQTIRAPLGGGKDGDVFTTSRSTAVKFLSDSYRYRRERDVYLRFREKAVTRVLEFKVPRLVSFHDDLSAVEITVIQPPFVLDFAGAYVDWAPDFPEEKVTENDERIASLFDEQADRVFALLYELRERHGIYMLDAWPGNIQFD